MLYHLRGKGKDWALKGGFVAVLLGWKVAESPPALSTLLVLRQINYSLWSPRPICTHKCLMPAPRFKCKQLCLVVWSDYYFHYKWKVTFKLNSNLSQYLFSLTGKNSDKQQLYQRIMNEWVFIKDSTEQINMYISVSQHHFCLFPVSVSVPFCSENMKGFESKWPWGERE